MKLSLREAIYFALRTAAASLLSPVVILIFFSLLGGVVNVSLYSDVGMPQVAYFLGIVAFCIGYLSR
ncbi:hypothetical protein ACFMI9_19445, partial [Acinetobacter baumannii]|uniref:hypothetical protein n=1 Tax=Acinetobacter baumannii TaxID=470 RepID=UPI00366C7303